MRYVASLSTMEGMIAKERKVFHLFDLLFFFLQYLNQCPSTVIQGRKIVPRDKIDVKIKIIRPFNNFSE